MMGLKMKSVGGRERETKARIWTECLSMLQIC